MPVHLPSPVIGSIVCTPVSAAVGESVCVEVLSPSGHRYDNTETSSITINGIAGSKHYLVWHRAGTKTIHVAAGARGKRQTMKTQVQITPPKDNQEPPLLMAYPVPHKPTAISLVLRNAPAHVPPAPTGVPPGSHAPTIPPGPIRPRAAATAAASRLAVTGVDDGEIDTRPDLPDLPQPGGIVLPPLGQTDIPVLGVVTQPVYGWNLGGLSMSSTRAALQHDFGDRLDPDRPYTVFHIALTVQAPGVPLRVIRRSVSILNPYYQSRQRGILRPPVADCDLSLRHVGGQFSASFSVRNPESRELRLTSMQLELMSSQGPRPFDLQPAIGRDILLKGRASTRINVAIANTKIPRDADAVAVHYKGAAPDGMPVEVSVYFDVPQHASAALHVNPEAQALLTELGSSGLVADPGMITVHEVLKLAERGVLPPSAESGSPRRRLPDVLEHALRRAPRKGATPVAQALHVEPETPVEGAECTPWNLPGNIPPGMQCVATDKKVFIQMPARFMNARKGDIVLNPGDGSLVSRILLSMSPAQAYSHSGIMTRNHDEITHSTGSQKRLINSDFIGTDGFAPDALKYAWPGVITQTVDAAVNGEDLFDAATGRKYNICDFGTLESKMNLGGEAISVVPAAVIKPRDDTPAIRHTLHTIADFAAQQAGKSHYRFFCYTDPTLVDRDKAPASAGWAANTYPTVCSSFVWHAIRQAKVPMEGGILEQDDLAHGAQIVPSTPDGLYLYQEAERLAAGEMLFEKVHEMVLQEAGWMGEALTDAADDTANQILNAFASDWCDTDAKDSEGWRQPGDSYAVSPANLAFYDAPLYGRLEPLLYRPARWEEVTVHVWKSVLHFGSVKGIVRYQGQPVVGARVAVDQDNFVHTVAGGVFTLDHVASGLALLRVEHGELSAECSVVVPADQSTDATIDLRPPSHMFRRIVIDGWMCTVDWELASAADPWKMEDIYGVAQLGPASSSHVSKPFELPCDDAVGRLLLSFDLLDKDAVRVHTRMRCYHNAKGEGDDYVETHLPPFDLPAGHTLCAGIEAKDGNRAYAEFTVTNKADNA